MTVSQGGPGYYLESSDGSALADSSRIVLWQPLWTSSELHQNGWVPGLVRPFVLMRVEKESLKTNEQEIDIGIIVEPQGKTDAVKSDGPHDDANPVVQALTGAQAQVDCAIYHPSAKPDCVGENVGRVKEVLHLGSVGQPLNQRKTTGDLLKVMHDLTEVHDHICELGILHRDVSWFNVMCNPKHVVKLHTLPLEAKVLSRPCVNQILREGNPEPCVLLAELDNGIQLDGTATRHPGERTGTPMFISAEVSGPGNLNLMNHDVDWLYEDLLKVEEYTEEFARAFPGDDCEFMRNFEKVMEQEKQRRRKSRKEPPSPPVGRHDRRHDAESIYWVFLWAFARARPLLGSTIEPRLGRLVQFCTSMFQHAIDRPADEVGRGAFLTFPPQLGQLFHPDLKPFEALFMRMARYVTLPWYLYCGGTKSPRNIMNADHVHIAFQRFVLAFALDPANSTALEIELDTQVSRYTGLVDIPLLRKKPMTKAKRMETGATGSASYSEVAPCASTEASKPRAAHGETQDSTSSLKRKAESDLVRPNKRKLSEPGGDVDKTEERNDNHAATVSPDDSPMDGYHQAAVPIQTAA